MLPANQDKLWQKIKEQFSGDSKLLIENGRHHSAILLLCSFIDITSSFYTGRAEEKGVGESFRKFIEDYMPIFCRTKFGDLLFSDKDKRVRDICDIIYYCYRNGTTHEGILPGGIEIIENPDDSHIMGFGAAGWVKLNIYAMLQITINGVKKYESDLYSKTELQTNFKNRFDYLNRQRFKKEVIADKQKPSRQSSSPPRHL